MTAPHSGRSGGKEQGRESSPEESEASGGPHFISSVPPNTALGRGSSPALALSIVLAGSGLPAHVSLAALLARGAPC